MNSNEYKKDLKKIQTNLMHPESDRTWMMLKADIMEWMNETRRTWSSAIFYLLEKGLKHERDGQPTERR